MRLWVLQVCLAPGTLPSPESGPAPEPVTCPGPREACWTPGLHHLQHRHRSAVHLQSRSHGALWPLMYLRVHIHVHGALLKPVFLEFIEICCIAYICEPTL